MPQFIEWADLQVALGNRECGPGFIPEMQAASTAVLLVLCQVVQWWHSALPVVPVVQWCLNRFSLSPFATATLVPQFR